MRNEDTIKMDINKRQVCQCWRSAEVLTIMCNAAFRITGQRQ